MVLRRLQAAIEIVDIFLWLVHKYLQLDIHDENFKKTRINTKKK
jgi:hypothetical protein